MVTLVVATTVDPASINPAKALLDMPGWQSGPTLDGGTRSFKNGDSLRLLEQDKFIIEEDDLDLRWEAATGEVVAELIFLSRHAAVSNRPALTIHPIGVPHLKDGDALPQGGRAGWAAPPCPRIGPWLILLKKIAESHNLVPEFEITLEATHHGPITTKPTMFIEIGSTEEYWGREDAAHVIALLVWEGLGLGEGPSIGVWNSMLEKKRVLLGIGGGHYVPRHMDVILKDGTWVGHLLSVYSLPMEDPGQTKSKVTAESVGGTWKEAIRVGFGATKAAFPGGEILAHLDHKSFKSWQKNAIIDFLDKESIKIGSYHYKSFPYLFPNSHYIKVVHASSKAPFEGGKCHRYPMKKACGLLEMDNGTIEGPRLEQLGSPMAKFCGDFRSTWNSQQWRHFSS